MDLAIAITVAVYFVGLIASAPWIQGHLSMTLPDLIHSSSRQAYGKQSAEQEAKNVSTALYILTGLWSLFWPIFWLNRLDVRLRGRKTAEPKPNSRSARRRRRGKR